MNYKEYFQGANEYFLKHKEHLRYGQALVNYLWEYSSKVYTAVMLNEPAVDPYNDDALVPDFLSSVYNHFHRISEQ